MPDLTIALPALTADPTNLLTPALLVVAGFLCAVVILEVLLFVGCSLLMTWREGR